MKTVIRVMESLVKLNQWDVERFDIQAYHFTGNIDGYVGYLSVKGNKHNLIIHQDGSFEWSEN